MSKRSRKKARREYIYQERLQKNSWKVRDTSLMIHGYYGGEYVLNKANGDSPVGDLFASYAYDYEWPALKYFKKK